MNKLKKKKKMGENIRLQSDRNVCEFEELGSHFGFIISHFG